MKGYRSIRRPPVNATATRRYGKRPLVVLTVTVLCLGTVAAVATTATMFWLDGPVAATGPNGERAINSHNVWAFDVTDKRQVVSWADDVFVGRVIRMTGTGIAPVARYLGESKEGTPYVADYEDGSPYTLYDVEVVESLKGSLRGTVSVAQDGGYKDDILYTVEGDTSLIAGRTYVFATKGPLATDDPARDNPLRPAPDAAWLLSKYGDIRIDTNAKPEEIIEQYRSAVTSVTEI
jgi:hypothetical protein